MFAKKALAASVSAAPKVYVEDVFSTYLYTGNGSSQTITNGIDLSGEGGLVWFKYRDYAQNHLLQDTAQGLSNYLSSNLTNAAGSAPNAITAFNNNGFTIGGDAWINSTGTYNKFVSWTFRKAKKFFDVVTYTGNGTAGRTVSHNLGSVPGCMIIKCTSNADDWVVYHRSLGATEYLQLESTGAAATSSTRFNDTTPTSTQFTVGNALSVNGSGRTYVAYLFAHDAGGFGDAGDQSVIKCGSYTGTGSTQDISLGWEPQWLLVKNATTSGYDWYIVDTMRNFVVTPIANNYTQSLSPNSSSSETSQGAIALRSDGFRLTSSSAPWNNNGDTFIYIAIRRGPMKTPTSGTSVFEPAIYTGNGLTRTLTTSVMPDLVISGERGGTYLNDVFQDRFRGVGAILKSSGSSLSTYSEDDWGAVTNYITQFGNRSIIVGNGSAVNVSGYDYVNWRFSRAPGFMDIVFYTGEGSSRTVAHSLGAVPELIIIKGRSSNTSGYDWAVYAAPIGATKRLLLNGVASASTTSSYWSDTSPTSSVFTVGTAGEVNYSGGRFVAYLFGSLAGISKIGSYTGNGSSQTINCGFTAGARFVLIKRTDNTGGWHVFDTARGIVSGNDPFILLNSTNPESSSDQIDPDNSGFIVNESTAALNTNGATYLYLAIA